MRSFTWLGPVAGATAGVVLSCSPSSSSSLVEGGTPIAIAEGEIRTLHLAARSTLASTPWAHVDNGTDLVLAPPCTLIKGTSGPPQAFVLEVTPEGGVPTSVVVEVHPSGDGACRPTVVACLQPATSPVTHGSCENVPACGSANTITDQRVGISFGSAGGSGSGSGPFSDPTLADQTLSFHVTNPGVSESGSGTDDPLVFKITTDAPLHFPLSTDSSDPCMPIINANIAGAFGLQYAFYRGSDVSAPLVTSGQYDLQWNRGSHVQPYGIELVSCAYATANGQTCTIVRKASSDQWCVKRPVGRPTSLGFRVWTSAPGNNVDHYALRLTAAWEMMSDPPVTLVGDTERNTDMITLQINKSDKDEPIEVTADVGAVENEFLTVTLKGDVMGMGFDDLFTRRIRVVAGTPGPDCP